MASRAQIYGRLAMSRIHAQAQYRLSFALQAVGAFGISFLDFVMVYVIFLHLPHLAGWSLPEIAFLYGTSYIAFKAADLLMGNLDRLPLQIRMGTFDQLLTRPLGSLPQVLCADLDVRHIGGISQGALVLAYAVRRLPIVWTPGRIAVMVSMMVSGLAIFSAIWIATNAVAFWTTDAREVANAFTYGGNYLTTFPLNVFGAWMRRLFAYLVPLAFVNYFPALYVLGRDDPLHAPVFVRFLSPVAAVASATVAGLVWRLAVRRYRSTGS